MIGPRFVIVGAGMAGILSAIKLQEAGLTDITVYEKADRLGGTWRENTYPGVACAVPSHLYRYSFAPNPEWSHVFSPGSEILAYFAAVARRYDVDKFIQYGTEIRRLEFRDGCWHIETADGQRDTADFVIAATGVLHHPSYPEFEDNFANAVVDAESPQVKLLEQLCRANLEGNVTDPELREKLRDGIALDDVWAKRPSAYLAISVPAFPNLFMLNGPNGPVGNFSLIEVAELQFHYIMQLVEPVRSGQAREVSATHDAADGFEADRVEAAKQTVWVTGCRSWYLDDRGVPAAWPWSFDRFRSAMSCPNLVDYELVGS